MYRKNVYKEPKVKTKIKFKPTADLWFYSVTASLLLFIGSVSGNALLAACDLPHINSKTVYLAITTSIILLAVAVVLYMIFTFVMQALKEIRNSIVIVKEDEAGELPKDD